MSDVQRFWCHEASNIFCVRASDFDRVTADRDALQQRLNAADQRVDLLEGLLLQTNELLYAIQADPGAVPSSAIDAMRGEVFTALKKADVDDEHGATEQVAQPFTEQFIEDHLGKMPDQLRDHTKMIAARNPAPDFSLIGIVHTPPVQSDEP